MVKSNFPWGLYFNIPEFFFRELLYDEPMPGQCCGIRMKRSKVAATQITIVKADGLVPEDKSSSKYLYASACL